MFLKLGIFPRVQSVGGWIWISAALLLVSCGESSDGFKKCCPTGQLLSGQSRVDCLDVPWVTTEIHPLKSRHPLFPNCSDPEDLTTTTLDEIQPMDLIRMPACVEVLHEERTGKSVPIVVHCQSNEEKGNLSGNDTVVNPMPHLLSVRGCCPRGKVYNQQVKACVSTFHDGNSSETENLLTLLPTHEINGIDFIKVTRSPPKCKGSIHDYSLDLEDVFWNGKTFEVVVSSGEKMPLLEDNACVEVALGEKPKLVVRACRPLEICQEKSCVRKCCSEDESLYMGRGCQKVNTAPGDSFHEAISNLSNRDTWSTDYGILFGGPCESGVYPLLPTDGEWFLTSEGHVRFKERQVYNHDEYCMEIIRNSTDYEETLYPFVCFDDSAYDTGDNDSHFRYFFNTALQVISCTFLLITLLIYICLPSLRNLHGKTLMCHVASLILAYVCLIGIPWVTPNSFYWNGTEDEATVVCPLAGYVMLFAFLSAFSWLNVMCIDIWWTFGGLRGHATKGRSHRKKFILYCLYAWGWPILLTTIAVVVDRTDFFPGHLRPNFNLMSCWFPTLAGFYGELVFFVGPILIQLVSNVFFFVLTTIHCGQVKDEIRKMAVDPSSRRSKRFRADRTKLVMNVKLFVVMGVSWVAEVASFFVNKYATGFQLRDEFFYATDAINCLQGLLIFVLFVLKPRVYQALRKRFGYQEKKKQPASQATTALQDPRKMKQISASCVTLTSSFVTNPTP